MTKEEQRARDAVVRAAIRWVKRGSFIDDVALARACARLAAIQKKEKRRVR